MSYRNCTFNDEKGCVDIQKIDITGLIEPSGIVFDKLVYFPAGLTGSTGSFQDLICTNQIKALGGITGSTPYAMIGAGGTTSDPDVRIEMNRSGGLMQMFYTNLQLTTSSLPNFSSGSSGQFLPITINGVNYKIALMLE